MCSEHFSPNQFKCLHPRKLLIQGSIPCLKDPPIIRRTHTQNDMGQKTDSTKLFRQEEETSSNQNQCWVIRMKPLTQMLSDSDSATSLQWRRKSFHIDGKHKLEMTITPYQDDCGDQLFSNGFQEENFKKQSTSLKLQKSLSSPIGNLSENIVLSKAVKSNRKRENSVSEKNSGNADLVDMAETTHDSNDVISSSVITNVEAGFHGSNTTEHLASPFTSPVLERSQGKHPSDKIESQIITQSEEKRQKLVITDGLKQNNSSSIFLAPLQVNESIISNSNENTNSFSMDHEVNSLKQILPFTLFQIPLIVDNNRRKRRITIPRFVGDFEKSDLECPNKRYLYWEITQKTIKRLRITNRIYSSNISKFKKQIAKLRMKYKDLYEKMTFLGTSSI